MRPQGGGNGAASNMRCRVAKQRGVEMPSQQGAQLSFSLAPCAKGTGDNQAENRGEGRVWRWIDAGPGRLQSESKLVEFRIRERDSPV